MFSDKNTWWSPDIKAISQIDYSRLNKGMFSLRISGHTGEQNVTQITLCCLKKIKLTT